MAARRCSLRTLRCRPELAKAPRPAIMPRRNYASGPQSGSASQGQRSSLVTAALLFTALSGAAMVLTSVGTNKDKRRQALEKLDTSRAARQTPPTIANKVDEAAETVPESKEGGQSSEQQEQESAYDPVTGEINWDCPCLGGMASGPCGEEFKKAFSCFVHSTEEPKGVDCIEHFKAMQDCFKKHPEHYANEIADDDDDDVEVNAASKSSQTDSVSTSVADSVSDLASSASEKASDVADSAKSAVSSAAGSVSSLVNKAGDDNHRIVHRGSTQKAYSEHSSPSYAVGSASKEKSASSEGKIVNQGSTQPAYSHHGGHAGTQGGGGSSADSLHPEKTSNRTGGSPDPLGRNAAKGSKPSGSDTAHQKHLDGVKATRSGEETVGSRNPAMRG